ncbi:hypothetical protein GF336_07420 [Candidatus Woesearchaeota archaeon]|nr:hypothetical protein [Candidatus Woesearchaeota archaeon]
MLKRGKISLLIAVFLLLPIVYAAPQGHSASEILAGTFASGAFIFPGGVTIGTGSTLSGQSWSIASDGATTGFQIDSGQLPASTSFLGNSISSGEVDFNYAGSSSKGGAASDVGCSNCVALGSETSGSYDSTADTIADDGVISSGEVNFNYAAGASKGGAATSGDSATSFFSSGTIESGRLPGTISYLGSSISSGEVSFNYAGSSSKGGAASNLACTACVAEGEISQNTLDDSEIQDNSLTAGSLAANSVGSSELADNSVDSAAIINGAVASGDVGFNYAGSSSKGGAASNVGCSNCVALGSETTGNYAGSSSEGGKANDADKLDNIDSTGFCQSDGTNCPSSAPLVNIRTTSIRVSSLAPDSTKDSQCSSEFGSDYSAATPKEFQTYLRITIKSDYTVHEGVVVAGHSDTCDFYDAYPATSLTALNCGSISGTQPVVCIYDYAPIRFTRSTISDEASEASKDSLCVSEFGSDYVAATMQEVAQFESNVLFRDSNSDAIKQFTVAQDAWCVHEYDGSNPSYNQLQCYRYQPTSSFILACIRE